MGEGRHFVELLLGPAVERVIVTLGALETGAEEDTHGIGHVVEWHATIAEIITDRTVALFPYRAGGGDEFPDELVVGLVGFDEILDEGHVGATRGPRSSLRTVLGPQDIRPKMEPMAGVTF